MVHKHLANGSNRVYVYRRKYLGDGMYYQKMVSPNEVIEGDLFQPIESSEMFMKVIKIISRNDSKSKTLTEEERIGSMYEIELFDEAYKKENYKTFYSI